MCYDTSLHSTATARHSTTQLHHCMHCSTVNYITPPHHSTTPPLPPCITYHFTASLHHCITAPLHHCSTASLQYCTVLHHSTALPNSSTPLHYITAPLRTSLHHCITPLHHCSSPLHALLHCTTYTTVSLYHGTTTLYGTTLLLCTTARMHYCHCITPLHHSTASLVITSLHHSTIHASASLHTSLIHYNITALHTPLHCLTNSSTPFHSITAPLATSLLCTTACTTATASLHCITTPPCHCITPPTHHCSTASLQFFHPTAARHCSTPLHCLTDSSIPLHHITALQRTSLLCTTVCPTANAHCTKLKAITKTLNKEDKHKGPVNLKKW
jgi:hypothetical protein